MHIQKESFKISKNKKCVCVCDREREDGLHPVRCREYMYIFFSALLVEDKLVVVVVLHVAKQLFEWLDTCMMTLVVLVVGVGGDDEVADGEGEHSLLGTLVAKGRVAWREELMVELDVHLVSLNVTLECTDNLVECIEGVGVRGGQQLWVYT